MRARISPESARMALDAAFSLSVEIVSEDAALCYRAYWWAEQLGQMAVYDALYLALAERLEATFHTADQALAERCRRMGVEFIQLLGHTNS